MKKALIKNNVVENIIEADSSFEPDQGYAAVTIPDNVFVDIGYLYNNEIFTKPIPSIDVLKSEKISSLNSLYAEKIAAGIVFETNTYQIRDQDRQNMNDVYTKLADGQTNPHGGVWRDASNTFRTMNDAKVKEFIDAVFAYRLSLLQALWTHKDNIRGMTRSEDVIDYDITANW